MIEQTYEVIPVDKLHRHPQNPRRGDVPAIREAIRGVHGFYGAVIVQRSSMRILAGNHRFEAMKAEGASSIPAIVVNVDDAVAKKILLADNRIPDRGGYDDRALADLLLELPRDEIADVGYSVDDLDEIIRRVGPVPEPEEITTDPDDAPEVPPDPVSKEGEIYELGPHRLICGDSTGEETWAALMGAERGEMLWTDPPYGVKYEGKTKAKLTIQNDDLPPEKLKEFIRLAITAAGSALAPGGGIYVAGPAGPLGVCFKSTLIDLKWLRQELQWVKNVFVMGRSDYHYRHEPIFYGWKDDASHRWYGGRAQDSILNFDRPSRSKVHPTMKPTALIARCIENSSRIGEIALDGFGGSGSTLIASAMTGRRARLVELDPGYCDVIRRRWGRYAATRQLDAGPGALL